MQQYHKTNAGALSGIDSGLASFGDDSSDPGTSFNDEFAANVPWGATGDQFALGYSSGGNHNSSLGSGGSTSSSNLGATATTTTSSTSTSTSGFVINITWDSSVASAPAGFTSAVMDAVHYLESEFHDPTEVNITVGYENLGSGNLGASITEWEPFSYSQVLSALKAHDTTAADATAIASLPASASDMVWTTPAEAQALGLAAPGGSDGSVWASSAYKYTYDDTDGVAPGTYDLRGVMLHEITEVMGRQLGPSVLGLFDYKSAGVPDTTDYSGYFSINDGTTDLAPFNTNPGGDAGDWSASVSDDAFDAFVPAGTLLNFSSADEDAVDVLGYEANSTDPPVPSGPPTPTGVSIAPSPGTLSYAMTATGLHQNVVLASFTETGGISGDTYRYTLSGANAASFMLSGNRLMATGTGASGAVNGRLFSLDVSATDTSGAGSAASPAAQLDLIVGSTGRDIIQVSSLASHSVPTFVYGLGGGDTINGAGMTSSLWVGAGPGGGDTLTGGSDTNRYMFSSLKDSPASAMDLITNFHAGADLLDMSGISGSLTYQGSVTGTINPRSVGWQHTGDNTYVFVNTGAASISVSAARLEIDLQGTIALASKNFVL